MNIVETATNKDKNYIKDKVGRVDIQHNRHQLQDALDVSLATQAFVHTCS